MQQTQIASVRSLQASPNVSNSHIIIKRANFAVIVKSINYFAISNSHLIRPTRGQ